MSAVVKSEMAKSEAMARSELAHAYADVLGVQVSAVNMQKAVELAQRWLGMGSCGYVCVTGVHGVMEAQRDEELRRILNRAVMNVPDGMPMTWVGRAQGHDAMDRVFGPEFMAEICAVAMQKGYRIFLYGGREGVAQLLGENLQQKFPGLQVAGTFTPPFGELSPEQETTLLNAVHDSRPHILWVGLSTPKQERFMARYVELLGVPLLVGVGAAFDFHTGQIRDCPHWMKRAGMQWAHRLIQDPRRLWWRYLRNNPAFLYRIGLQLCGLRRTTRAVDVFETNTKRESEVR